MEQKPTKEYSFGIIPARKDGGKYYFLLVHRLEGFWELPKGHAEDNENDLEAARREFSEETGLINIKILKEKTFENTYFYKRGGETVYKTVKYYLGLVPAGEEVRIQKEEMDDYKWAEFDEARRTLTHQNSKELLEDAHKTLISSSK